MIAFRDSDDSNNGKAIVGTVSGTGISFGTAVTFDTVYVQFPNQVYDANAQKIAIVYQDATAGDGWSIVGTVSGTSISFGTAFRFTTNDIENHVGAYDSAAQKVVYSYRDNGNSSRGTTVVGTISGTSISFGTAVLFTSNAVTKVGTAFQVSAGKVAIVYQDSGDSDKGKVIAGTVSGTTISFGSNTTYNTGGMYGGNFITYDSGAAKNVIAYGSIATPTAYQGFGIVQQFSTSNSGSFLGIADAAISNAASGNITMKGGIATNSQLLPQEASAAFGTDVAFQSGEAIYESICYDTANDKIVIAYMHNVVGAQYGKAIVGTVSGTSISFGSAVTFNAATTNRMSIAFDASAGKVVIAYTNDGNSGYGTAIVGTVSGTSISFGTAAVFESANTGRPTTSYDANASKVLICYKDAGNSNYLTGIVGTVSGTSISFGTAVALRNTAVSALALAYDSTAQKHALVYVNSDASNRGDAGVVSISGTTPSVGTFTDGLTASMQRPSATYDSSSGKVVVAYQDNDNSDYATAAVGTISGTSITFGSAVVVNAASSLAIEAVYDATSNATFVLYKDGGNSSYGTAKGGIVSGTNISFGSATVFLTANPGGDIAATIDTDNNKLVAAYVDYGNSQNGTAVVGTPSSAYPNLVPNSTYYVQDDGTLSTTSSSVTAGKAMSTTSINLDYST